MEVHESKNIIDGLVRTELTEWEELKFNGQKTQQERINEIHSAYTGTSAYVQII